MGHKPFSLDDAVRYRDGLMIALLARVPLRHKNFAALEIGHLRDAGAFERIRRTSLMCGRGCCVAQDARLFG